MALGKKQRFSALAGTETMEGETVNLVPIMNLFVVLIPFLLMSAAFFHISVINASVPALQTEKSDMAKSEVAITMMVQILPTGYRLVASSDTLPRAKLDELRAEVPLKGEAMDFEAFGKHLLTVKQQYPKSETLILVPEASILYDDVIHTMDAARWWEETAKDNPGKMTRYELFPNVVISGML